MNYRKAYKIILTSFVTQKLIVFYSLCAASFIVILIFLSTPKFNSLEVEFLLSSIVEPRNSNTNSNMKGLIYSDKESPNENTTIEIISRALVREFVFNVMLKNQEKKSTDKMLIYLFNHFPKFHKNMYNNDILVAAEGLQPKNLEKKNERNGYIKFIFSKQFFYPKGKKDIIINKDFVLNELKLLISGYNLSNNTSYKAELDDWSFYINTKNFNIKNHIYKLFSAIVFFTILIHSISSLYVNKKKFKLDKRSK